MCALQMNIKLGSLFSGFGGFELGFEEAGMECRWQCEIDDYASKVLKKLWPKVRNLGDITKVDWREVEPVDAVCGGFPCQDVSQSSSTKAGLYGTRSGLWSEYVRCLRLLRRKPRIVVVENVDALRGNGLGRVLRDLASLRFDALWSSLSSCTVGSAHMRWRMFIVAYADQEHGRAWLGAFKREIQRQAQSEAFNPGARLESRILSASRVNRSSDGVPHRRDRVGGLGNAVDACVSELIGRAIMETEKRFRSHHILRQLQGLPELPQANEWELLALCGEGLITPSSKE